MSGLRELYRLDIPQTLLLAISEGKVNKLRSRSNDIDDGHASQLETISSSPANVKPNQDGKTKTCTGQNSKKGVDDGIRPSKTLTAGLKAKKRSGPVIHAVEIKKAKMSRDISNKASVQKEKNSTKKNLPKIKRSKMSRDNISNKASFQKGKNSTNKNLPKKYSKVKRAPLQDVCKKTSSKMPPQRNGSPPKGKAKAVHTKQVTGKNKQRKAASSSSLKKKSVKIRNNVKSGHAGKKVKGHKKKIALRLPSKKVSPSKKKVQTASLQGKDRKGHKGCSSELGKAQSHCAREFTNGRKRNTQEQEVRETTPCSRKGKKDRQSVFTELPLIGRKSHEALADAIGTVLSSGRSGSVSQTDAIDAAVPASRTRSKTQTGAVGRDLVSSEMCNGSLMNTTEMAPAVRTRNKVLEDRMTDAPPRKIPRKGLQKLAPMRIRSCQDGEAVAPPSVRDSSAQPDVIMRVQPFNRTRNNIQRAAEQEVSSIRKGSISEDLVVKAGNMDTGIQSTTPRKDFDNSVEDSAINVTHGPEEGNLATGVQSISPRKGSVSARKVSVVKVPCAVRAGDLDAGIQSTSARKGSVSAREDSVFKVPCDLQRVDLGGDTSIQPCGLKGDDWNTGIQSTSPGKDFANSGEESAVKKPCDLQRGDLSTGIQSASVLQQVDNDMELAVLDEDVNSLPVAMEEDDDDDKEESVRCGPKEEESDSTLQEPSAASGGELNPTPPHPPTPPPELQNDKRKECSGPSKDDHKGHPLTHVDEHTDDQEDYVVSTSETQRREQMRTKDADNQRGGQLMNGSDNQRESADNHDKAPVREKNADNHQEGTDIQNEGRLIEDTDNHHQKDADAHTVMPLKKNGTDNQREVQLREDTDNHQRGDRHAQTQKQLKRNSTDNQRQGQLRKKGADKSRETEDANDEPEESESRMQLRKDGADNQRQGQLRKEGADKPRETEDANDEESESRTQLKKNGADNQRQGQLRKKVADKRRETKDTNDEESESMGQLRREEELRQEEAEARRELEKIRELIRRHKEEETMRAAIKLATKDQLDQSPEKGKPGDGKEGKKNVPYASRTQEDTMDDDETDSNYEDDLTAPGHVAESKDEDGNGGDPPEGATSTCLQGDNRKGHGRRLRDRKSLQLVIEKLVDRTNSIGPVDSQPPPIGDGHSIAESEDGDPGSAAFESRIWQDGGSRSVYRQLRRQPAKTVLFQSPEWTQESAETNQDAPKPKSKYPTRSCTQPHDTPTQKSKKGASGEVGDGTREARQAPACRRLFSFPDDGKDRPNKTATTRNNQSATQNNQHSAASDGNDDPGVTQAPVSSSDDNGTPGDSMESRLGELVWGHLSRQRWWPGIIIQANLCHLPQAKNGAKWLFWYGDHKISEVAEDKIIPFVYNFRENYKQPFTKMYVRGVEEAVRECALRCNFSRGSRREDEGDYDDGDIHRMYMEWAKEGFPLESDVSASEDPFAPNKDKPLPADVLAHLKVIADKREKDNDSQDDSNLAPPFREEIVREKGDVFAPVREGKVLINDVCIACDADPEVVAQHPMFEGGLCDYCKESWMETIFTCGEDGSCVYCTICNNGGELFMCDAQNCHCVYCSSCVEIFAGPSNLQTILQSDSWVCFLCTEYKEESHGMLRPKSNWQNNMLRLFQPDCEEGQVLEPASFPRRPLRVLSLFDGIGTGRYVLDELGLEIEVYLASEIDEEAITVTKVRHGEKVQHIGDVRNISSAEVSKMCPIDLLIGGSPCNELSLCNPARKGLGEGSGLLFFEFQRILCKLKEHNKDRHLFWMFENVYSMPKEIKSTISRFLSCEPVKLDAKDFSAQHRARYFWGNIPGMYSPLHVSQSSGVTSLENMLVPHVNRKAKVHQIRTLTTNSNSLREGKHMNVYPVLMGNAGDTLWITEIERIFGFPEHYTDICNLSPAKRQRLIGKAWSVPVVKCILSPLRNFYSCEAQLEG